MNLPGMGIGSVSDSGDRRCLQYRRVYVDLWTACSERRAERVARRACALGGGREVRILRLRDRNRERAAWEDRIREIPGEGVAREGDARSVEPGRAECDRRFTGFEDPV